MSRFIDSLHYDTDKTMPPARPELRLVDESTEREPELTSAPSLEQAFRLYSPYLAKVGFRVLGRADEVEDLVQDVFLTAAEGLRRLRDPSALRAYLATIAVRLARRRLKRQQLLRRLGLRKRIDYCDLVDHGVSPEDAVLLAQAYRALDRLPADVRLAWTLRVLEGERLDRVAALCECSLATAKRRIAAAHGAIRQEVDHG